MYDAHCLHESLQRKTLLCYIHTHMHTLIKLKTGNNLTTKFFILHMFCDLPSKNQHSLHLQLWAFNDLQFLLGKPQ